MTSTICPDNKGALSVFIAMPVVQIELHRFVIRRYNSVHTMYYCRGRQACLISPLPSSTDMSSWIRMGPVDVFS